MESKNDLLKTFGQRLHELRESKNMTVKQLGQETGLSGSAISRFENGAMEAKKTSIQVLANYFNVNPVWLMGANVEKYLPINEIISSKEIPIFRNITEVTSMRVPENIEGYEYSQANIKVDFCLRVKDDSMINARIGTGDLVFINEQSDVENGEIAAIIIDGKATLRRVFKYPGTIILRPENPKYEELVYTPKDFKRLSILGKCIAVKFNL